MLAFHLLVAETETAPAWDILPTFPSRPAPRLQRCRRISPFGIQLCHLSSCCSHNTWRLVATTLKFEAGDYRTVITWAGSFQPNWFVLSFKNLLVSKHSRERSKHAALRRGSSRRRQRCAARSIAREIFPPLKKITIKLILHLKRGLWKAETINLFSFR